MAWCTGCGRPLDGHAPCRREDGPRRFCPSCGRRLVEYFTPGSVDVRCRDCGPLEPDGRQHER